MVSDHPYKWQAPKAFWRQTVSERHFLEIPDWYSRKWPIADARIAAAGSCFAQHIGRHLRDSGFRYLDVEPPPSALRRERWSEYGYGMYSARYGNVYSPRQLLQLLRRALGEFRPQEVAWERGDGYVDPFRPTIEPEPYSCVDEVVACRESHLRAVSRLFEQTDVFVFTLGLTEAWVAKGDEAVFPVCPGTQGGVFDPDRHRFVNFSYPQIRADMEAFIQRARAINGEMRFLLTVSPVPLTATATSRQVVVATTYSKSVLRAVAGYLEEKYAYVDYFPSYEIISSHPMRGALYGAGMRSVAAAGVEHVMAQFFGQHAPPRKNRHEEAPKESPADDDVVCDEVLLEAFGKDAQ